MKHIYISASICCIGLTSITAQAAEMATISADTAVNTASPSSPAATWLQQGWQFAEQNNFNQAVQSWQAGVDALPAQQLLLFAGVYYPQSAAIRQLKHLGARYSGIMLRSDYQGKQAWFVLAAPAAAELENAREALQTHLNMDRVWANSSRRYQTTDAQQSPQQQAAKQSPPVSVQLADRLPLIEAETQVADVVEPSLTPQELFLQAKTTSAQGKHTEALNYLSELLSVQPGHQSGLLMYGSLLVKTEQYAEASLILPSLLSSQSHDWRPWYWMGTAALMLGHLEDASSYLSQAVARNGKNAALWVQRAIVEQEQGRHQTALQLLNIAKKLDPKLPEVVLNIAYSADALGQRDAADQAYSRFLILTANSRKHIHIRHKILSAL